MRIGSFSCQIVPGKESGSGYVSMQHNQQYKIRISSHEPRRATAEVTVDGKNIGTFLLSPHQTVELERPPHDNGCFTFLKADTQEAAEAGAGKIDVDKRGLVQVRFIPERARFVPPPVWQATQTSFEQCKTSGSISVCGASASAGITALTGSSGQQFFSVGPVDVDPSEEVVITLRLVCLQGSRELTPRCNSVPPAV